MQSPLDYLSSPIASAGGRHMTFNMDDYQDSDLMVRDLLKIHKIDNQMANLSLLENINDNLLGKV